MAFEEIKARTVKELLAATTDQDRAEKWHDHRALERVERCLQQWAAGPKQ